MDKKVLFVASTSIHITNFHIPYLAFLKEKGFEVHVISNNIIEHETIDYSYDIDFDKKMFSLKNLGALRQIKNILNTNQYKLIILHTTLAAAITRLAYIISRHKKVNIINMVHGYLFGINDKFIKRMCYLTVEKIFSNITTCIITMNNEDYKIAKQYKLAKKEVVNIPGIGVKLENFAPSSEEERIALRRSYRFGQNDFIGIYVAEFSNRKNQMFLIENMKEILENAPNTKLILIGSGKMFEACKGRVKELGLDHNIIFPGYTKQVREYMAMGDVIISSSKSEGLPFNIMEGMACGLPILASNVKGHQDLVKDGKGGYLFTLTKQEYIDKLKKLIENKEIRKSYGNYNKKQVERFSLANVFHTVTMIYSNYMD